MRNAHIPLPSDEWLGGRQANLLDPGNQRDATGNLHKFRPHGVGRKPDPFQIQRRDREPIGSKANVHRQLLAHAAQAECRAAQERERPDDLRDDQAVTQPRPFSIRSIAAFRILERDE